jgi:hypothetical protein
VWTEQKFESSTKAALESSHGGDAGIWSKYEVTRNDVLGGILPWIAAQEPALSDHGVDHIANVIQNVGRVLGMNGSGTAYPGAPLEIVTPVERLLLMLGCLLHDIGNIKGRKKHNLVVGEVWKNSGGNSFGMWTPADRKTIVALCKAHTGKAPDGSEDTLKHLAATDSYFLGENVPLARLAATLRFADELAEGVQRTSRFLLFQQAYGTDNVDYHRYANATEVTIDRAKQRIALNYTVELDDPGMSEGGGLKDNLSRLLGLIMKRVVKLEHERVYARHYAPDLLAFSETSVVIDITRSHETVCALPPLVLNDFNLRSDDPAQLAKLHPAYDVESILAEAMRGAEGEGRA